MIAVADDEFPTDRYVVDGRRPAPRPRRAARARRPRRRRRRAPLARRLPHGRGRRPGRRDGAGAAARGDDGLGPVARRRGARTRPAGAGVELAVGCTYKFLNGGPGAPAFTYVAALHDRVVQPIWGWFGQTDQFAMERPFDPRAGIGRLLNGTPGVLGLVGAREGITLTAEAGMRADRREGPPAHGIRARPGRTGRSGDRRRRPTRGAAADMSRSATRTRPGCTRARRAEGDRRPTRPRHPASRHVAADDPLHRRLRRDHDPRRTRLTDRPVSTPRDPRHAGPMSVVKINAIDDPRGMGPQLEERFAGRARWSSSSTGSRTSSSSADRGRDPVLRLHPVGVGGRVPGLDEQPGLRTRSRAARPTASEDAASRSPRARPACLRRRRTRRQTPQRVNSLRTYCANCSRDAAGNLRYPWL